MNSLILHSYRRCPFAIRVRTALEEKGLPYAVIEENLRSPSLALLKLHPEGKVPLLIHNGNALPESAVITEYLDEAFPEKPLRPATAIGRAQIRLWTKWCDQILKPDLDAFKYEFDELGAEEKGALLDRLKRHLGKMEEALGDHSFLLGNGFTLADIHLFPFYRQLSKTAFPSHHHSPKLDTWLTRITERPAFERVMEKK
jgi:glutathione S-transferase